MRFRTRNMRNSTTFPGLVRILLFRCRKAVKNGIENLYSRSDCDSFVTDIDRVIFIFYNTEKERKRMLMKLLFVEDDQAIAMGLVYTLKKEGYEVVWCDHKRSALAAAGSADV